MNPYVYVEYPKCLYNDQGGTLTVDNEEEEAGAVALGWKTAKDHFARKKAEPVVEGQQ